jgi:hypothetical protein
MQPCREALRLVEAPKSDPLEGGEELKGLLLLLCEVLHLFVLPKVQFGERGREQGPDGRSKETCDVIHLKLLQFGGRGWERLFIQRRGLGTSKEIGGFMDSQIGETTLGEERPQSLGS